MRPVINCISLNGASMPPELSERLGIESVHLYNSADKKRDFKGLTYAGRIKTDRQWMSFFGISGVVFNTEIEFESADKTSRKVKANYIVSSSVLNMNFREGYDFVARDIREMLSTSNGDVDEAVCCLKKNKDTIGDTVGTC